MADSLFMYYKYYLNSKILIINQGAYNLEIIFMGYSKFSLMSCSL